MPLRLTTWLLALLNGLGVTAPHAQMPLRPDFSGTWRLESTSERDQLSDGPPTEGGRQVKKVNPAPSMTAAGTVLVKVWIARDGKVVDATILRSIPQLDRQALEAVVHSEYSPPLRGGRPVPAFEVLGIGFSVTGVRETPAVEPPPDEIAVTQTATSLTVTHDRPAVFTKVVYRLDGMDSRTRGLGSLTLIGRSRWDGEKLVTTFTGPGVFGPATVRTETRTRDADVMTVDEVVSDPLGGEPWAIKRIYRKVK